jgi:hypothetical protein
MPEAGMLYSRTLLIIGALNVNPAANCLVPTTAETVTTGDFAERIPGGERHMILVLVDQLVVWQLLAPIAAVGERSDVTKFIPIILRDAPPVPGEFGETNDNTGESKEKRFCAVPTTALIVTCTP